jgi:hypothetical protein
MSDNKEKSHKYIANIGIIILSTVFCLFLIETGLRLFRPLYFAQPIGAYEYDKDLGYRLRAGIHSFFLTDYQQEFRTNQLGTLNFQEDLSKYEIILFALGDSYTQGLGVPNDCSFPFHLDLLLNIDDNGNYSKKYGVVNLGLGPYGAKQELITLKLFAECLRKPNIVLYLGCDNDYSDDMLFESGIRHKNIVMNNPHYGWLYYPMKWFFIDTEIGKRIKWAWQEGILRAKSHKIKDKESRGRSVAEMEKNEIEKIVKTTKRFGAVPILSWSNFGESYDWLKSWAAKNDILFADWRPKAMSVSHAIPELPWQNSHSTRHYRSWVNCMIARAFAQEIREVKKLSHPNSN